MVFGLEINSVVDFSSYFWLFSTRDGIFLLYLWELYTIVVEVRYKNMKIIPGTINIMHACQCMDSPIILVAENGSTGLPILLMVS